MTKIIFLKELREMLRDRRVVVGSFLMPVFIVFLIINLNSFVEGSVKSIQKETKIHLLPSTGWDKMRAELTKGPGKIAFENASTLDEAKTLLKKGKAKLVLQFESDFDAKLAAGKGKVQGYFDSSQPTSEIVLGAFRKAVGDANLARLKLELQNRSISPDLMESIKVEPVDTADKSGLTSGFAIMFIPYLIILWAFYGGMGIVGDLVAGEKERGTLETLLVSPVTRTQVALGKLWALATVCLASSLSSLIGLILVGALKLPGSAQIFPDGKMIPIIDLAAVVVSVVPLVVFFAGLLMAVSAWAKNMREAQTFLASVSFVVLIPAIFSQVIGFTDLNQRLWVKLTPVLNTAVGIRSVLLRSPDYVALGLSALTGLIGGLAMLAVAVYLFKKESILTRS